MPTIALKLPMAAEGGSVGRVVRLSPSPVAYVLCQVVGWGAWATFGALFSARLGEGRYGLALFSYALYSVYGIISSHLLRQVIQSRRWLQLPAGSVLVRVTGAAVVCVIGMTASLYLINVRLLKLFDTGAFTAVFFGMVAINTSVIYGVWVTIYLSVHSVRRRREAELRSLRLELALRDAQYRSLSAQVNPHFLFNSLNSLRALILIDPQRAITAVTHLAGVLRYSLAANAAPIDGKLDDETDHELDDERSVCLRAELEAVNDYLALERIRFEDRLRVTQQIDPEALNICVPRMILQHLVENAVKHGIARNPEGGEIHVVATISEGLQITVINSGRIGSHQNGTGLENTRQRLRLLYGASGSAACTLEERDGMVVASLRLPLRTSLPRRL